MPHSKAAVKLQTHRQTTRLLACITVASKDLSVVESDPEARQWPTNLTQQLTNALLS